MPPPPLRLTAPPALPGGLPEPTPADLAAFAPGAPVPPVAPAPLAQPRLLTPPVSYANEPRYAHPDTTPRTSPDFYVPTMPSGLVTPDVAPDATLAAHAREASAPRRPSLFRAPAAAPVEQPADFIDAMTASPAPMYVEPQETPYDRERRAIESARSLEVQRGEMLARQAAERIDAEEAARRRADRLEVDRREAEGRAREAMQRSVDRLAEMRVEPNRYWRDAGAFGIIGNALAVGLGSIGEALGGGPERTVSTINASIDRDIRAQEQDIATAGADVESRRGILAEVQREYQSREAAMEATRAIMLREAAAQAEMQAAQQGTAEVNANAARARDQLLTQAELAQAAAERAEVTGALEMREQLARISGLEARATRDWRRAMGGGGGPVGIAGMDPNELRTRMTNADALIRSGRTTEAAEQAAGLPPGTMQTRTVSAEESGRLGAYESAIRALEEVLPSDLGQSDDMDAIEGVGPLDSVGAAIPVLRQVLSTPRGRIIRSRAEAAARRFLRVESGGAITRDEEDDEIEAMGLGVGATEAAFIEGVQRLRRDHRARVRPGGNTQSTQAIISGAADGMTRVE